MKTNMFAPESYETPKVNVLVVEINTMIAISNENSGDEEEGD